VVRSRAGFLPGRKVFLPCNRKKLGGNTFLPGRNGRKWGEMEETGEKLPDVFILRCKA